MYRQRGIPDQCNTLCNRTR